MAIEPVTREERFLAAAGGQSVTPPTPITRKEQLLQGIIDAVKSGGATPDVIEGAVNDYLNANPVQPGATAEQAAQIEQNKTDIADLQTEVDELKESGGNGSGEDGFSPIATVTQTAEGATISITDKNGTTTATVTNGKDGKDGADGAPGEKGDKGDKGDPGEPGQKGEQGIQGIPGEKGDTGAPGADGVKGDKGDKGDTGAAGKDGSDGIPGAPGADGSDGYTPVRGVDYWTPDDIAAMDAKLAQMLAERAQLRPEPAESLEWLNANGDPAKFYVLLDKTSEHYGYIYAYMLTEVESGPAYTNVLPLAINADGTPFVGTDGEKGYKLGYRLNSSDVEKAAENRAYTGYIAAKSTDTVRIENMYHPTDGDLNGYIKLYSGSFALIASGYENEALNLVDGKCEFVPSQIDLGSGSASGMAYFRISTGTITDDTIITINEEIVDGGTTTGYAWANTGIAFVSTDYGPRVTALEKQTDQNTADIANLKNGVASTTHIKDWDKPIYDANIPVFHLSAEKAAMTNATNTPANIYAMYDALMAKHPRYITKTDLGLCSDGVNHVYRYDFREPDSRHTSGYPWSETKAKAIIVSGIHFEWSGIYGLYYALEEIAENPDLYALRRNTHLIVVPCMNPYATIANNYQSGLPTPNSQGVRNANGVEIHRNFEVGWVLTEEGTTHYGGPEPLSEVETQYVDTIMRENADAALFLTCHNFGDKNFNFIWPSTATAYMCNMGYRLIDKLSRAWLDKYADELVGLEEYRTDDIPAWDNRLGFAHISQTPGTETRQGTKYNIQSANVEINGRFWVHGTEASPEPSMSAFTMSRGAEVYINFLLTVFGCYDPKDKALHAPAEV